MKMIHNLPKPVKDVWYRLCKKEETAEKKISRTDLKKELQELKLELDIARDHFDNETDFELIDAHIWELKALEVRYEKAFKKAKMLQNANQISSTKGRLRELYS